MATDPGREPSALEKIGLALRLLDSMVRSRERHTGQSESVTLDAFGALGQLEAEAAVPAGPHEHRWLDRQQGAGRYCPGCDTMEWFEAAAPAGTDAALWNDVRKFVRWSANVRDDTAEAIAVARALNERIDAALRTPTIRAAALAEAAAPAGPDRTVGAGKLAEIVKRDAEWDRVAGGGVRMWRHADTAGGIHPADGCTAEIVEDRRALIGLLTAALAGTEPGLDETIDVALVAEALFEARIGAPQDAAMLAETLRPTLLRLIHERLAARLGAAEQGVTDDD